VPALTNRFGANAEPQVSPDGKTIAYVGFDERHNGYDNVRLYLMDADGGHPRSITDGVDRSVGDPRWAAEASAILAWFARYRTDRN
jgi:Tol biopolymer transport system component